MISVILFYHKTYTTNASWLVRNVQCWRKARKNREQNRKEIHGSSSWFESSVQYQFRYTPSVYSDATWWKSEFTQGNKKATFQQSELLIPLAKTCFIVFIEFLFVVFFEKSKILRFHRWRWIYRWRVVGSIENSSCWREIYIICPHYRTEQTIIVCCFFYVAVNGLQYYRTDWDW